MRGYDHRKIEKKWQKVWDKNHLYKTRDFVKGKENLYLLVEFPYPSGNLHVGHWYAFAVPDILARAMRMQGKNVLYPIGFDAFGLPAENAAIKNKINPRVWTLKNIEFMKKQIRSMGTSFDWSREVVTCDPAYYKWTQWLFLQFFKKGLVYRKETAVNWCPSCKTVLANEQVVLGKCERCGTEVVQRQMLQWNIKITDYADRLIDDLDALDWPEQIKESQRNWIGRSEGAEIDFVMKSEKGGVSNDIVTVFTTRADTLYGATYLVLAPEHPWIQEVKRQKAKGKSVIQNWEEVEKYIEGAKKKTDLERQTDQKDKTGIELKGVKAINPATGKEIPVYVADYVLGHYGTGAVMGVPAHDDRDGVFAKKYGITITEVIEPLIIKETGLDAVHTDKSYTERNSVLAYVKHWSEDKYLAVTYKPSNVNECVSGGIEEGEDAIAAGKREIREETGYRNARFVRELGGAIHGKYFSVEGKQNRSVHFTPLLFQLEDDSQEEVAEHERSRHDVSWLSKDAMDRFINRDDIRIGWKRIHHISTTYTGEGILVNSGEFSGLMSDEALPKIIERFGRRKTTYKLRDWIVSRQRYWGVPIPIVHCPTCGPVAVQDKDLPVKLPEVKDYLPEGSGKSPLAKATKWVNVKCPSCGGKAERETDTLDTFVDSSWYFMRYTDPKNKKKFADAKKLAAWMPVDLYSGGAEHTTMHVLYSRFWQKAMSDLGFLKDKEPYTRRMNRSLIMGPDGQKMSKSKGNVIDPDEVVAKLGSDTVRMYLAFIGPYNEVSSYPWNPDGVVGVRRFLERLWRCRDFVNPDIRDLRNPDMERLLHKTIKKVGEDIAALKFNTAISQLMILLNAIEKEKNIGKNQWETFLKILAPFAPHMAEDLWAASGKKKSIHKELWPTFDQALLKESIVTIAIQINGKTRGETSVAANADKVAVERAAKEAVKARLEDKKILRTIVVPGRLVNFVVEE